MTLTLTLTNTVNHTPPHSRMTLPLRLLNLLIIIIIMIHANANTQITMRGGAKLAWNVTSNWTANENGTEAPQQVMSPNTTSHASMPSIRRRRRRRRRRKQTDVNETSCSFSSRIKKSSIDDNLRSNDSDSDDILVSCLTWNLAEIWPEDQTRYTDFLIELRNNGTSDLICVCIQECENPKPRRTEGSRSRSIRSTMIQAFGNEYVPIVLHSLGGLQIALFAHKDKMLHRLDYVSVADVACGVGNVFHNKGAIGAFVKTRGDEKSGGRRLMFLSSHLAAHASNVDDRNANYWRILGELEDKVPPRFLHSKSKLRSKTKQESQNPSSKLMDCLDYIFWCGDLNYRIDLPREYVEHVVLKAAAEGTHEESQDFHSLLRHDQLLNIISSGKAFNDFSEGMYMCALVFCVL